MKAVEMVGKKFGRLSVLGLSSTAGRHRKVKCLCVCGKDVIVFASNLKRGLTSSCGCKQKEAASAATKTHGLSRSTEYESWLKMRSRCYDTKSISFKNYGGRGITVCERWRNNFESFISDMGKKPKRSFSIERKNNDGNYTPDNCVWASPYQQARNKRTTKLSLEIVADAKRRYSLGVSVSSLANEIGCEVSSVYLALKGKTWSEVAA